MLSVHPPMLPTSPAIAIAMSNPILHHLLEDQSTVDSRIKAIMDLGEWEEWVHIFLFHTLQVETVCNGEAVKSR